MGLGLLLGLLVAPAILLQLGHRLRDRTQRQKRMFWGGVIGHSIGAAVTIAALLLPPVMWSEGTVRMIAGHWAMVIGTLSGFAITAAGARPPVKDAPRNS